MIDYAAKKVRDRPLHDMFTAVPRRYDLINRIITLGRDEQWRQQAARECLASRPERVLDLCCGTGDLAINLARLAEKNVELTGIDYSQPMLDIAAKKAEPRAGGRRISCLAKGEFSLSYAVGTRVKAVPNSIGVMCFNTKKNAGRFSLMAAANPRVSMPSSGRKKWSSLARVKSCSPAWIEMAPRLVLIWS